MIWKTALTCLAAVLAVSIAADTAAAKSKQRKRIATPAAAPWSAPVHQQSARMIEVKPGLWISSYGCVTNEGYGRYSPCDLNDSGGR